jgi:hypothetical protein
MKTRSVSNQKKLSWWHEKNKRNSKNHCKVVYFNGVINNVTPYYYKRYQNIAGTAHRKMPLIDLVHLESGNSNTIKVDQYKAIAVTRSQYKVQTLPAEAR